MNDSIRQALVIRFGRLGDMLVVTPVLRAMRRALPDARVDVLTSRDGVRVLTGNPHIRDVHEFDWRRVPRILNPQRAMLLRRLRAVGYDAVFLLETGDHYRAFVRDLAAPRVFTFARTDEAADEYHARRDDHHELFNFFGLLALAGIPPAGEAYTFDAGSRARQAATGLLTRAGVGPHPILAGVHAGHFKRRRVRRTRHPKSWPLDRWVETVQGLLDAGHSTVVLTGSRSERRFNRRIARGVQGPVIDLAGRTDLHTLAAIIEKCRVFVSPDTGPAHLAAAVHTPLVALFGPKSPDKMGPRGDDRRIARLYPQPSDDTVSQRHGYHPRMWAISPADVLDAVRRVSAQPVPAGTP